MRPDDRSTAAPGVDVVIVDLARRAGGAERRVLELAAALLRSGTSVDILCLQAGALAHQLRQAGLPHTTIPYGRGDPRSAMAVAAHLRRVGARVVDAHNVQSQLWSVLAARAVGTPERVATVHSEYRWSEGGRLKGWAYDGVLRLARRAGWRFIAVSDTVAAHLSGLGVPDARTTVVWSAVAATTLTESSPPSSTRVALGCFASDVVVVCVARLVPAKDHGLLLRAFASIARDLPTLKLLLVGSGPCEPAVRTMVTDLGLQGRALLLGHRDDVPQLLALADACVLSSRTEGLPYALLEAAAAGTPVVSTRVGAIGRVFTDGRTALLVEPGDVTGLAAALRAVVEEPDRLRTFAANAHRDVVGTSGLDAMVDATLRAYGSTPADRLEPVAS